MIVALAFQILEIARVLLLFDSTVLLLAVHIVRPVDGPVEFVNPSSNYSKF